MSLVEISHESDSVKGVFLVARDGKRAAEMTYVMSGPSVMIIDHTEIGAELKGQGVGKELVVAAVQYARRNNLKIMPLCPFAKAEFDRHTEYRDIRLQ